MEKFGHFFEFIAAVNSAYIVSDFFINNLLRKVNGGLMSLKKIITQTEIDWKNTAKYFQELVQLNKLGDGTEKKYKTSLQDIRSRITDSSNEVEAALQNKSMFNNFNYWCLYSCLFCILILILNGYQYNYEDKYKGFYLMFFGVVAALVTLISLIFSKEKDANSAKKAFSQSYNGIVTIFFSCLIVIPSLLHYARIIFKGLPFINSLGPFENSFVETVCIILTIAHFFYYYIVSFFIVTRKCLHIRPKVQKIVIDRANLMQELKNIVNAIDDFNTTKGNNHTSPSNNP